MNAVEEATHWIKNVLKMSDSYSNEFYYDGGGVVASYEKSIQLTKKRIKLVKERQKNLEKIHQLRLEKPSMFSHIYEDINRVESDNQRLELDMVRNELRHDQEILIILKNLVGITKITDTLMQELPKNAKTAKLVTNLRKFQLIAEPTIDSLNTVLNNKLSKNDKDNFKHR